MKQINPDITLLGPAISKAYIRGINGVYHMHVEYENGANRLTPKFPARAGVYTLVIERGPECCEEKMTVQVPGCQPHRAENKHTPSTLQTPVPTCPPEDTP